VAQGALTRRPLVSLITDWVQLLGGPTDDVVATLFEQVAAAVDAGVDLIQVREPDLPDRVLLQVVSRCVELARGSRTVILVNDRLDIALAAGAGGMHLRSRSVPAGVARRHTPAGFLLGRSVHGVDEAVRVADSDGLDFLVLGTVFTSRSKPGVSPCGVGVLTAVTRAVALPVLAIGGVTVDKTAEVFRAGAAGVAAIGLFAEPGRSGRFEGMRRIVGEVHRFHSENHVQRR
jgi:thiamine-phosphate pyrophosphorylase